MKKMYLQLIVLVVCCVCVTANAQELRLAPSPEKVHRCYTVEAMEEARRLNPSAETDAQFENWMASMIAERNKNGAASKTTINYTVPVIFHIIHNGEAVGTAANPAAAVIKQQILQLNKAYGNLTNSQYAAAANTGITFVLAQKNVAGTLLAEPGIERISRASKSWTAYGTTGWNQTYINSSVKPTSIWDATKYINIWMIPVMTTGTSAGDLLGFATFPTSSGLTGLSSSETASTAGVAIQTASAGSTFTPAGCGSGFAYSQGGTLVHELGHFFGLRHIWGDATCGDDYCGDTPVHETSNNGVPKHPKPNNCGTTDEMFENYMDYSDDAILNTFTADQVARIQTVMVNSPRRNTLAASAASTTTGNAGSVAVTGSNTIAFTECSGALTVSETGTTGTTTRYKDISLNLNAEYQANGSATATISTSGTAVVGVDYQVLTPTVSFASGDAFKAVKIRILDNAQVDGNRTIIVSYFISSGFGVTPGTTQQSVTITIQDDDNVVVGQGTYNIFNQDFENFVNGSTDVNWKLLASTGAVNKMTVSANGNAESTTGTQAAHITNDPTLKPLTYTKSGTTASLAVVQSPLINAATLKNPKISFKWKAAAESTTTDYGWLGFSPGATYTSVSIYNAYHYAGGTTIQTGNPIIALSTLALDKTSFYFDFGWSNDINGLGTDPPVSFDDIILSAEGTNVETAITSSYAFKIVSGNTASNYLKSSANDKIIATISNISTTTDEVKASVTESGIDMPTIITTAGTFNRSRKTIKVLPTAASSASYTATFYFTTDEVAAWGAGALTAKVIKLDNGIDIFSTLNAANSVVLTPTVDDQRGTNGYISYTVSTTGFGQFALVSANTILPVRLLSFTGTLDNSVAKLKWNTTSEINNAGFEVLRGTTNTSFEKIGWVTGLNRQGENEYSFNDKTVVKGTRYYYRLKQIDKDGQSNFSNVITLFDKGQWITIKPNPFKDKLTIQNNLNSSENTEISISDIAGKIVYKTRTILTGSFEINTSKLTPGTYLLSINTIDGVSSFKVIKE